MIPRCQAAVDGVCLRLPTRARGHGRWPQWREGPWWAMGSQTPAHRSPAREPPAARWLRGCQWPATARALAASLPTTPPCVPPAAGFPMWPATLETASHATSSVPLGGACARGRGATAASSAAHRPACDRVRGPSAGATRCAQGQTALVSTLTGAEGAGQRAGPAPHPSGARRTGPRSVDARVVCPRALVASSPHSHPWDHRGRLARVGRGRSPKPWGGVDAGR